MDKQSQRHSVSQFADTHLTASAADEPRRSGRATKGQHKNLDSGDETPKPKKTTAPSAAATPAAAPAPTPSASKKSGSKKAVKPEPEEEEDDEEGEEEEEEEVIRCVCGDTSEKGPPDFVSCDACQVWQHNVCMDLPTDPKLLPEHYLCEQCHPEAHPGLLQAIERGEKPWEDRQRAWRNAKKRGKNRRKTGDRQSTASELKSDLVSTAASSSPAPAPAPAVPAAVAAHTPAPAPASTPARTATPSQSSGNKRKFVEDEQPSQVRSANPHRYHLCLADTDLCADL